MTAGVALWYHLLENMLTVMFHCYREVAATTCTRLLLAMTGCGKWPAARSNFIQHCRGLREAQIFDDLDAEYVGTGYHSPRAQQ